MKIFPSSVVEAKACGAKRYFTGRPCPNGHLDFRLTSNSTCVQCAASRHETWVAGNRDKVRANYKRYIEKSGEHAKETHKAWREKNKERVVANRSAWRDANRDKVRQIKSDWKKRNPHFVAAEATSRRSAKMNATPPWADMEAILNVYIDCARTTRETGIVHHVDHIVPLRNRNVCGLHVHYNLRVIPALDNWKKNNRFTPYAESIAA